jgi:hypothetical protein
MTPVAGLTVPRRRLFAPLFDEWPTVARYWQVLTVAVLTGLIVGGPLLLRGRLDHEWMTNAALAGGQERK